MLPTSLVAFKPRKSRLFWAYACCFVGLSFGQIADARQVPCGGAVGAFVRPSPDVFEETHLHSELLRYRRIRFAVRQHRFREALRLYERAPHFQWLTDRVSLLVAKAERVLGQTTQARQSYQRALQSSEVRSVREEALRELIALELAQKSYTQALLHIEALQHSLRGHRVRDPEPEHHLSFQHIEVLRGLGRHETALQESRRLLAEVKDHASIRRCLKTLQNILGTEWPRHRADVLLLAAEAEARGGRWQRALSLLRVGPLTREQKLHFALLRAKIYAEKKQHRRAQQVLSNLMKQKDLGADRAHVLLALGQHAKDLYRYPQAEAAFAELIQEHAAHPAAIEAQFLWGEMAYERGLSVEAATRLSSFDEKYPQTTRRMDAAWLAAWSTYLSGETALAIDRFEALVARQLEPQMRDRAEYWLARSYQEAGQGHKAQTRFARVQARAPFSYYGLLAAQKMGAEHLNVDLSAYAHRTDAQSAANICAALGERRPQSVDRGIHFAEAGMGCEAAEEWVAAAEHYRSMDDPNGIARVAELFTLYERDAWAFLLARKMAPADAGTYAEQEAVHDLWRFAYPKPFENEVHVASEHHALEPLFVYSVMRTESRFRPEAHSPVGARGLMQLMPKTARWIGRVAKGARPHVRRYQRPASNIWLGTWYLQHLLSDYAGDLGQTLAAYNAGPGAVNRWKRRFGALAADEFVERVPFDETRNYMKSGLTSYMMYRALYGKAADEATLAFRD